jgi:hypothetical protein
MAVASRSSIRAYRPTKPTPKMSIAAAAQSEIAHKTLIDPTEAKRELLDDLMGDVEKCLSNKSRAEQKAVASMISKIARS